MIDRTKEWYIRATQDEEGNVKLELLKISPETGKWEIKTYIASSKQESTKRHALHTENSWSIYLETSEEIGQLEDSDGRS